MVQVRPDAFKRCLANLVSNAVRFGSTIALSGSREPRWLMVHVDDNGPGIPEDRRDDVFRPFLRLDDARNQNETRHGTWSFYRPRYRRRAWRRNRALAKPARRFARDRADPV